MTGQSKTSGPLEEMYGRLITDHCDPNHTSECIWSIREQPAALPVLQRFDANQPLGVRGSALAAGEQAMPTGPIDSSIAGPLPSRHDVPSGSRCFPGCIELTELGAGRHAVATAGVGSESDRSASGRHPYEVQPASGVFAEQLPLDLLGSSGCSDQEERGHVGSAPLPWGDTLLLRRLRTG